MAQEKLQDQTECPLCMEPLEIDDMNFYPCTCGYQICRFCWHRIRTNENGLCPACRKQYPEDPAEYKPLTAEELQKIKNEKRQKDFQKKQKVSENRKMLSQVRVVQKNLLFVVGLTQKLADPEILKKHEYFGRFGKINKIVINTSTTYAGNGGPTASAYITFYKSEDALKAIEHINHNHSMDGRVIKASLGTTKYCSHFLKGSTCPKTDCMYLHEMGEEGASFTKEEMQIGKHQEYEMRLLETCLTPPPQPTLSTNSSNTLNNNMSNCHPSSLFNSSNATANNAYYNGDIDSFGDVFNSLALDDFENNQEEGILSSSLPTSFFHHSDVSTNFKPNHLENYDIAEDCFDNLDNITNFKPPNRESTDYEHYNMNDMENRIDNFNINNSSNSDKNHVMLDREERDEFFKHGNNRNRCRTESMQSEVLLSQVTRLPSTNSDEWNISDINQTLTSPHCSTNLANSNNRERFISNSDIRSLISEISIYKQSTDSSENDGPRPLVNGLSSYERPCPSQNSLNLPSSQNIHHNQNSSKSSLNLSEKFFTNKTQTHFYNIDNNYNKSQAHSHTQGNDDSNHDNFNEESMPVTGKLKKRIDVLLLRDGKRKLLPSHACDSNITPLGLDNDDANIKYQKSQSFQSQSHVRSEAEPEHRIERVLISNNPDIPIKNSDLNVNNKTNVNNISSNEPPDWQEAFGFGPSVRESAVNHINNNYDTTCMINSLNSQSPQSTEKGASVKHIEDDLGFDPWNESTKALEELIQLEQLRLQNTEKIPPISHHNPGNLPSHSDLSALGSLPPLQSKATPSDLLATIPNHNLNNLISTNNQLQNNLPLSSNVNNNGQNPNFFSPALAAATMMMLMAANNNGNSSKTPSQQQQTLANNAYYNSLVGQFNHLNQMNQHLGQMNHLNNLNNLNNLNQQLNHHFNSQLNPTMSNANKYQTRSKDDTFLQFNNHKTNLVNRDNILTSPLHNIANNFSKLSAGNVQMNQLQNPLNPQFGKQQLTPTFLNNLSSLLPQNPLFSQLHQQLNAAMPNTNIHSTSPQCQNNALTSMNTNNFVHNQNTNGINSTNPNFPFSQMFNSHQTPHKSLCPDNLSANYDHRDFNVVTNLLNSPMLVKSPQALINSNTTNKMPNFNFNDISSSLSGNPFAALNMRELAQSLRAALTNSTSAHQDNVNMDANNSILRNGNNLSPPPPPMMFNQNIRSNNNHNSLLMPPPPLPTINGYKTNGVLENFLAYYFNNSNQNNHNINNINSQINVNDDGASYIEQVPSNGSAISSNRFGYIPSGGSDRSHFKLEQLNSIHSLPNINDVNYDNQNNHATNQHINQNYNFKTGPGGDSSPPIPPYCDNNYLLKSLATNLNYNSHKYGEHFNNEPHLFNNKNHSSLTKNAADLASFLALNSEKLSKPLNTDKPDGFSFSSPPHLSPIVASNFENVSNYMNSPYRMNTFLTNRNDELDISYSNKTDYDIDPTGGDPNMP
ncbi:unnamed protein product [Gordionus sp. m RMFG-2023]|uniref:GATA zinc finger domain-containing protein 14-like isoform X2 n=1 Tax=Gordionus sp. m RMFG-2023 TaxID=3053472 RepID=UPI0030E4354D